MSVCMSGMPRVYLTVGGGFLRCRSLMEAIQSVILLGCTCVRQGSKQEAKEARTCWLAFSTLLTATGCILLWHNVTETRKEVEGDAEPLLEHSAELQVENCGRVTRTR